MVFSKLLDYSCCFR